MNAATREGVVDADEERDVLLACLCRLACSWHESRDDGKSESSVISDVRQNSFSSTEEEQREKDLTRVEGSHCLRSNLSVPREFLSDHPGTELTLQPLIPLTSQQRHP